MYKLSNPAHFLQVSHFYPLFLDSRKIFEGVGMEDFHTFFASQSFYPLVLDKRQGNNTAYDRIAATIWVTILALN